MARGDDMVAIRQPGDQFKTRLPEGLHQRLKVAAAANKRSANQEIVARLEASFEPRANLASGIATLIERHVEEQVQERLRQVVSKISGGS